MKQLDKNENPDQNQKTQLSEREKLLEEQLAHYRTLLEQKQTETDERKLEKQAEALSREEAALEEQADLTTLLKGAFPNVAATSSDDSTSQETPQLSQKELIDVMGEVISKSIDANSQLILNQVSTLMKSSDEKIAGTQKALVGLMSHISVSETKGNHSDYDVYKEDIADIMSKTNGLSIEQAYVLAKAQKTEKTPGRDQIETERPDSLVSRSYDYDDRGDFDRQDDRDNRKDAPRNPRKDFRAGVSAAVDKVIAARSR